MKNNKKIQKDADILMKNAMAKETCAHTVNLSKIEGEGSFPCPKCGTVISPDDESEEVYTIVDTKMVNNELDALVISCCTCGNVICVTGFQEMAET
jgi:predicted RNA-binding Zn-ribbon protein involved in translation (DUF1610 family)